MGTSLHQMMMDYNIYNINFLKSVAALRFCYDSGIFFKQIAFMYKVGNCLCVKRLKGVDNNENTLTTFSSQEP